MSLGGSFRTKKKDGTEYFRASITHKDKHISLGSFSTEEAAGAAYAVANDILRGEKEFRPEDYDRVIPDRSGSTINNEEFLQYDKWIMLLNLRKTGMYCKNPIYLYGKYFVYFLDRDTELKFDADELFFYRDHRLMKRGGHFFYSDFGSQCSLMARYGVKSFAVEGRDYIFKNGDRLDFRFGNLVVINKYYGVGEKTVRGIKKYSVKIHVGGNVSVGSYSNDVEAAVAYNKAADSLEEAFRKRKNRTLETGISTNVENKILGNEVISGTIYAGNGYENEPTVDDNGRTCVSEEPIYEDIITDIQSGAKNAVKAHKTYKKWRRNYIEGLSRREYISIYEHIKFNKSFKKYLERL